AGPGIACFPLSRKVPVPLARIGLKMVGAGLILFSLLFAFPMTNQYLTGFFWFFTEVGILIYGLIWFRGTWPRFRYDQLMDIGWESLIPLGLIALGVNAVLSLL